MSDDEADPELLELLRQAMRGTAISREAPETHVLESAEYVYNNSIDVAIDMKSTKQAADLIYDQMHVKQYSRKTWSEHPLHPRAKNEE